MYLKVLFKSKNKVSASFLAAPAILSTPRHQTGSLFMMPAALTDLLKSCKHTDTAVIVVIDQRHRSCCPAS